MIGYIVVGYILDLQGFRGKLKGMRKVDDKWHVEVQVMEVSALATQEKTRVFVYDDVQLIECH